jgi:hypothetical protein
MPGIGGAVIGEWEPCIRCESKMCDIAAYADSVNYNLVVRELLPGQRRSGEIQIDERGRWRVGNQGIVHEMG